MKRQIAPIEFNKAEDSDVATSYYWRPRTGTRSEVITHEEKAGTQSEVIAHEEKMAPGAAADQARHESQSAAAPPEKAGYKSYKKKYRKMRNAFEKVMSKSNELFRQEQEATETARRLTLENDAILDLLMDLNDPKNAPNKKLIIDLESKLPGMTALPDLPPKLPAMPEDDFDEADEAYKEGFKDYLKTLAYAKKGEEVDWKGESLTVGMGTSLAKLMATVPHQPFEVTSRPPSVAGIPLIPANMAKDLEITKGKPDPVAYISAERYDEYLSKLDTKLGLKPAPTLNTTNPDFVPAPPHLSDRDLEFKNPSSVYNWLRTNKPNIFLQDSEPASLIEKAATKPGALRGAGKRAVLPAPSKPDAFEIVEEDGLDYNTSIGVVPNSKEKGKRKRVSDEDGGYRPKGGSSRPKKKRSDSGKTASVKKEKKASPLATKSEDVEMADAGDEYLAPE